MNIIFQNCNIEYKIGHKNLIVLRIGKEKGISDENAKEIVDKFKDDKFIKAFILDNSLYVKAIFPDIYVDCRLPEEKSSPLRYALKLD